MLFATVCVLASGISFAQANLNNSTKNERKQAPPAAKPVPSAPVTEPVVGNAGLHGDAIDLSTTASTGVETPGAQTTNGLVQQPDKFRNIHPVNPLPAPGAPPNWEQVGQEEAVANSNAAAAARAEIGGPEGTLGVGGALPSYSRTAQPIGAPATRTSQPKSAPTPKNERRSADKALQQPAPPQ
jgi:hypothetical protein